MLRLKFLGICDFLNFMITKIEEYDRKGMHEVSELTTALVVSMQRELKVEESMYRSMKVKYKFDHDNSYSVIESITSHNIQDYLRVTAFRSKDVKVKYEIIINSNFFMKQIHS